MRVTISFDPASEADKERVAKFVRDMNGFSHEFVSVPRQAGKRNLVAEALRRRRQEDSAARSGNAPAEFVPPPPIPPQHKMSNSGIGFSHNGPPDVSGVFPPSGRKLRKKWYAEQERRRSRKFLELPRERCCPDDKTCIHYKNEMG